MPSHCCVYNCTKKGYRDEDGTKISFKFPTEKNLKSKWKHAIRRDEGKDFQIGKSTMVCSRHFRENDIRKTLAGKNILTPEAVPSLFPWTRTSPRKRQARKERYSLQTEGKDNLLEATEQQEVIEEAVVCELVSQRFVDVGIQTDCAFDVDIDFEAILTEVKIKSQTIRTLEHEIQELLTQKRELEEKNEAVTKKVFTLHKFMSKNCGATFYTGFEDWNAFMAIYRYLEPGEKGKNIKFWLSSSTNFSSDDSSEVNRGGRPRTMSSLDEYFLVMCRLRQGFHEEHLAHLFDISISTVSRIFITWINLMFLKFGGINIWPLRETVDRTMPEDFKKKYSSTRVIIDCTEIKCQMPTSLHLNGELFSSYKNHTTLKGLVGISPGGTTTFISQLYTGSISDREIVMRSGFLDLPFQDKDSVMADKGFTIDDLLPLGVSLNLPPFLGSSGQMPAEDVVKTQEITSLRIHIERAINKIKNFHIFDRVVPLWSVCAMLCNAQPNIISV